MTLFRRGTPKITGPELFDACRVKDTITDIEQNPFKTRIVDVTVTTTCPKLEDQGRESLEIIRHDTDTSVNRLVGKALDDTAATFGKAMCRGCDYTSMSDQLEVATYRRDVSATKLVAAQTDAEMQQLTIQLRELGSQPLP